MESDVSQSNHSARENPVPTLAPLSSNLAANDTPLFLPPPDSSSFRQAPSSLSPGPIHVSMSSASSTPIVNVPNGPLLLDICLPLPPVTATTSTLGGEKPPDNSAPGLVVDTDIPGEGTSIQSQPLKNGSLSSSLPDTEPTEINLPESKSNSSLKPETTNQTVLLLLLFKPLIDLLKEHHKDLQSKVMMDATADSNHHLQIWPFNRKCVQLPLLPAFYIMAYPDSNQQECSEFVLKLVTFQGRVLQTQSFKCSENSPDPLLSQLGSFNLCPGYTAPGTSMKVSDRGFG